MMERSKFQGPNRLRNRYFVGEFGRKELQCSLCLKKFLTKRGWKIHMNVVHDRYNLRMNLLNYVNKVCTINQSQSKCMRTIYCWQCNKKYHYNEDRVQHFVACHFTLYPSTHNALEVYLKSYHVPIVNQLSDLKAISNKSSKSFKCWKCDKQLQSQNGRLYHFIQKHARTVLSINTDPSDILKRQIEIVKKQVVAIDKDNSVSTTAMQCATNELSIGPSHEIKTKQTQVKTVELTYTRSDKVRFCPQCNKKFRSTGIFKKHINAKHFRTISDKIASKTESHSGRTILPQEKLGSVEYVTNNAYNPFICSQYPEQIEVTANSIGHHSSNNHVESTLSALYTETENIEQRGKSVVLSIECPRCTQIFESITTRDNHYKAKHLLPESHTSMAAPAYIKTTKDLSDPIQRFACWQCRRKFASANIRLDHFLRKHAIPLRSKMLELSYHGSNHRKVAQMLTDNAERPIPSAKRLLRCWQCVTKKFHSERRFLSHFASKHCSSILSTDTDPSSYLENQLILAEKHMNIVQDETILKTTSFSSAEDSENFGLRSDRDQHHEARHGQLNIEEQTEMEERANIPKSLSSDHFHCEVKFPSAGQDQSDLIAMNSNYKSMASITRRTSDPLTVFSCWECSKEFKTAHGRRTHYINHHIASILSLSDLLSNNAAKGICSEQGTRHDTTLSSALVIKQYRCWSCTKRFKLQQSLIAHFIEKHANFILFTTIDAIDILKNEIIKAKQQIDTSCTDGVASYTGSEDFEKSKLVDIYSRQLKGKDVEASVPVTTVTTNRTIDEKTVSSQVIAPICSQHNESSHAKMPELTAESTSTLTNQSKITMKDQNSAAEHIDRCLENFSCWKCLKKCESACSRLHHFLLNHFELFLTPTIIYSKLYSCWKCGKKFKCYAHQVSHFIGKHAEALLAADIDPSDALRNQIANAQERTKIKQCTITTTRTSFGYSQCSKIFKTTTDCASHFNSKHSRSTLTPHCVDNETVEGQDQMKSIQQRTYPINASLNNSKCSMNSNVIDNCSHDSNMIHIDSVTSTTAMLQNNFEIQDKISQDHTDSRELKRAFIHISYHCQQCDKEFMCAADHLEHFQKGHTEMKSSSKTLEEYFADPAIMQCPKAKSITLVYIYSELMRKQILVTSGKMNRCPSEACAAKGVNYGFKEFWLHILKEHKNTQIRLECCDPMIMHTPEEYKNHILL